MSYNSPQGEKAHDCAPNPPDRTESPTVEATIERGHLVIEERQNPFGWLACERPVEVRR